MHMPSTNYILPTEENDLICAYTFLSYADLGPQWWDEILSSNHRRASMLWGRRNSQRHGMGNNSPLRIIRDVGSLMHKLGVNSARSRLRGRGGTGLGCHVTTHDDGILNERKTLQCPGQRHSSVSF